MLTDLVLMVCHIDFTSFDEQEVAIFRLFQDFDSCFCHFLKSRFVCFVLQMIAQMIAVEESCGMDDLHFWTFVKAKFKKVRT